jgi:UPF0755 protein
VRLLSNRGSISRFLLSIVAVVIIVAAGFAVILNHGQSDGEVKSIIINRGATVSQVTTKLDEAGVIKYPQLFKGILRFTGGSSRVRAGEFAFRSNMKLADAINVLYFSDPITHAVTVPEGWNSYQIAKALEDAKLVSAQKFLALVHSKNSTERYKIKAPSLEGFLYPDTYHFSIMDGEDRILNTMVTQFLGHITPQHRAKASAMGWTFEQLVTFASIVEKETGIDKERPLVSSVFHNRLKKKMRLQSDPTTIYGLLPNFDGNLKRIHLETWAPYNTYRIPALPPGPIASPGVAAIEAALNPTPSNYLYFVANKTGGHTFSTTYAEHARNVNSYQKPTRKMASPKTSRHRK